MPTIALDGAANIEDQFKEGYRGWTLGNDMYTLATAMRKELVRGRDVVQGLIGRVGDGGNETNDVNDPDTPY